MSIYILLLLIPLYSLSAIALVNNLFYNKGLLDFYPDIINRITQNEKIHKVAYDCEPCISGQIALWSSVILLYNYYEINILSALYAALITLSTIGLTYIIMSLITTHGEDI